MEMPLHVRVKLGPFVGARWHLRALAKPAPRHAGSATQSRRPPLSSVERVGGIGKAADWHRKLAAAGRKHFLMKSYARKSGESPCKFSSRLHHASLRFD